MDLKRIAAAAFSLLITGGALSYTPCNMANCIAVQAASDVKEYKLMGVTYSIYSDHCEVTDGSQASGDVFIPVSIGGQTVTVIGGNAFKGSSITSVSMSSVTQISSGAFRGCQLLETVAFPSKLATIGSGAFADCPKLTEADLPQSVKSVGEDAFSGDKSLKTVTVRNPLCEIGDKSSTLSGTAVTISGYTDSTAQKYAEKYGFTFRSLGVSPLTTTTAASTTTRTTTTTAKPTTTSTTTKATTTTTSTTSRTTTKTTTITTTKAATTSTTAAATTVTTTGPVVQGKPVLRISETKVWESDLLDGGTQRVALSVEGANGLYCSSDIYVYFDSRLKLAGSAVPGFAVSDGLTTVQSVGDTGDFLFLSTAGESDSGKDGDMWYIDFELPANAKKGDRYEIYVGGPKYEGRAPSLFTNLGDDSNGQAMNKHIFSVPAKGAIEIVADPAVIIGDVNENGTIDGIDASIIITEYARLSVGVELSLTGRQFKAADVNSDGVLSAVDASAVLSYYAYVSVGGTMTIEEFINASR